MKIKARRTKENYIYHKMVKLKNYKRKHIKNVQNSLLFLTLKSSVKNKMIINLCKMTKI